MNYIDILIFMSLVWTKILIGLRNMSGFYHK